MRNFLVDKIIFPFPGHMIIVINVPPVADLDPPVRKTVHLPDAVINHFTYEVIARRQSVPRWVHYHIYLLFI